MTEDLANTDAPAALSARIPTTFTVFVGLLVVLAMSSFWLVSYYNTKTMLERQAENLGTALVQQTATQITELMLANDLISMNVVLGNLVQFAAIAEVSVFSVDGILRASASSSSAPASFLISLPLPLPQVEAEFEAPIELADSIAGFVRLRLDVSYIEITLINNLLLVAGVTVLLLLAAALLTIMYFQTLVSFPARLLAYSLARLRDGWIENCPEPKSRSELAVAIRQFNATAAFLSRSSVLAHFSQSPELAIDKPKNTGSEQQTVSLLAIELANFQYLASTLPEATLVDLLNSVYFYAGKISRLYGGTVIQCREGSVLVSFSSVALEEEQAFLTVCAGQLFLLLIEDFTTNSEESAQPKFRLAAHSGTATAGLYSPVTDSNDNLLGPVLDQTQLLCAHCPDDRLLISQTCLDLAGADSRVETEDYGTVDGLEDLRTHLSLRPMSDYRRLIERQAEQLRALFRD